MSTRKLKLRPRKVARGLFTFDIISGNGHAIVNEHCWTSKEAVTNAMVRIVRATGRRQVLRVRHALTSSYSTSVLRGRPLAVLFRSGNYSSRVARNRVSAHLNTLYPSNTTIEPWT